LKAFIVQGVSQQFYLIPGVSKYTFLSFHRRSQSDFLTGHGRRSRLHPHCQGIHRQTGRPRYHHLECSKSSSHIPLFLLDTEVRKYRVTQDSPTSLISAHPLSKIGTHAMRSMSKPKSFCCEKQTPPSMLILTAVPLSFPLVLLAELLVGHLCPTPSPRPLSFIS